MTAASSLIPPYINGQFYPITRSMQNFSLNNPANPSDILATTGWSKDFVEPVLTGMKDAQKKFRMLSIDERLNFIKKIIESIRQNAEEIKSNMMLELARSKIAVEDEWNICESFFQSFPEFCQQALSAKRDEQGWEWVYAPLGMVLVASNVALPVYSLLTSALPALAAGNAVCMRPSSHCVLSGSLLASCFHQADLPAGIIQVVYGDFEVFRRFVLSHQFDTIYYTGGEESLEQIRRDVAIQQNIRLVLCGGGKNAAYVTSQANIENAIKEIIFGVTIDAGQRLESTGLAFIEKSIFDQFQEKFVQSIKKMPIGAKEDLSRSDVHVMEPLCSLNSWERFLRFQGIAARESQETLRWGKAIDNLGNGYFVSPGVHLMPAANVLKSVYASNAFFGPDICLVPIDNKEEMYDIVDNINAIRSFSVHSKFQEDLIDVRRKTCVPHVLWNSSTTKLNPILPCIGKGRAGNNYVTGARFLLSTVYPRTVYCEVEKLEK